jgi:hypothetical protein
MWCVWIYQQLTLVTSYLPACRHEERVVEKVIVGTNSEECRRKAAEVRVER